MPRSGLELLPGHGWGAGNLRGGRGEEGLCWLEKTKDRLALGRRRRLVPGGKASQVAGMTKEKAQSWETMWPAHGRAWARALFISRFAG